MSNDVDGWELQLNQRVAYIDPYTHYLKIGVVAKVTPKGASIKRWEDRDIDTCRTVSRRSDQLAILPDDETIC